MPNQEMLVTLKFDTKFVQRIAQALEKVTKERLLMFNHALSRYNVIIVKNSTTYSSIIISASIFQTVYMCKLHRPSRIWKTLSHVQQFFTNNGINATITLNQATDRITIRSDQNVFLVFQL